MDLKAFTLLYTKHRAHMLQEDFVRVFDPAGSRIDLDRLKADADVRALLEYVI